MVPEVLLHGLAKAITAVWNEEASMDCSSGLSLCQLHRKAKTTF